MLRWRFPIRSDDLAERWLPLSIIDLTGGRHHLCGAVRVQPLLRGGEMPQQDAALPVETSTFHDHAGQESEASQIETAGRYQKPEPASGHHRALPGGVHGRRFTRPTLAPRNDRSCSDSRATKAKELRRLSGRKGSG